MNKFSQGLKEFGLFLFNKEKKEVFGRNWQSWGKITSFFIVLYAVLAGIFAVHLTVFVAITPHPAEGVQPWNYGQYGYPNYPNSKIALVAIPRGFTYKRTSQEAVLSTHDKNHIQRLLQSANASGVSSDCLDEGNNFGFDIGEPCIFVHVLKVHEWTPEMINSTFASEDNLPVKCSLSSPNLELNITDPQGIPLNLTNTAQLRSFPYSGQPNYNIPVTVVKLNLTEILPTPPAKFKGFITCSVNLEDVGIVTPSNEVLNKLYEIPADSVTKIHFQM